MPGYWAQVREQLWNRLCFWLTVSGVLFVLEAKGMLG